MTAYVIIGKRDGNGRHTVASVDSFVSVAKGVSMGGQTINFHRALYYPGNFTDKELRLMLALTDVLGNRRGKEQHGHCRVSLKTIGTMLGIDWRTAKTRLEGLAERQIIHFHQTGRNTANTTYEVGWNLHFWDWRGVAFPAEAEDV